jgi:hypothetical protein
MSKRAGEELKQLAMQVDGDSSRKTLFEKTSHDVQRSLVAFQNAQKVSKPIQIYHAFYSSVAAGIR